MAVNLEAIKSKVGPLPVWVWGVLAGTVGLGVYYVRSVQSANNAPTPEGGADQYALVDDDTVSDNIQQRQLEQASYETNDSWSAKALRLLVGAGYNSVDALTWIQNFLGGVPNVGTQAKAGISSVLDVLGQPPQGTYGTPSFVDAPPTTSAKTVLGWRTSASGIYIVYTDKTYSKVTKEQWIAAGSPPRPPSTTIGKNRTRIPYVPGV